jgi:hypothetical protein
MFFKFVLGFFPNFFSLKSLKCVEGREEREAWEGGRDRELPCVVGKRSEKG